MSKGSKVRQYDKNKFNESFDRIFGERENIGKMEESPAQLKVRESLANMSNVHPCSNLTFGMPGVKE